MKKNNQRKFISFLLCFFVLLFVPYVSFAATTANVNASIKTNIYPIVMVHGLFGWGSNEMLGVNYWGGLGLNIKADMEKQDPNVKVFTPTVGSMSSNWDRACELYAELVGGTADYGAAHSAKAGHARYGRTYPGFYTNISDVNKIHLIGHSMGGETCRVLVQLLEQGDAEELKATGDKTSPLFTGNHHWVCSVTTIATPHDGSLYDDFMNNLQPLTQKVFAAVGAQGSLLNSNIPLFDFKLDQWGIKKQPNETNLAYFNRVATSPLLTKKNNDLSIWDLAPAGAKELNSWVKAQSDVYYFSYACLDTHLDPITGFQVPNLNMTLILAKSALYTGCYISKPTDIVKVDSSWWKNDGVVSVPSAIGPHLGSTDTIVNAKVGDTTYKIGVWNYLGLIDNTDHVAVVGLNFKYNTSAAVDPLFFSIENRLSHLHLDK